MTDMRSQLQGRIWRLDNARIYAEQLQANEKGGLKYEVEKVDDDYGSIKVYDADNNLLGRL